MRITTVALTICSLVAVPCFAVAQTDAPDGKIIMYREGSLIGAAIACPIRHKGVEVAELGRGKYAAWPVKAGRYILNNKTSSVEVAVDPGETRYIKCGMKAGFMAARADLMIVDEADFVAAQPKLKEKPLSYALEVNQSGK